MAYHMKPTKKPLTLEEEIEAFADLSSDSEELQKKAIDNIVEANLKLVYKVAHEFKKSPVDFEDLVSEGCTGLMYAVNKFDVSRGIRFITYAVWWIKQKMRRAIELQGHTVRIPQEVNILRAKILRAKNELEEEFGYKPDIDDIAEYTGIDKEHILKVETSLSYGVSIEAPIDDGERTVEDTIADENSKPVQEKMFSDEMHEKLRKAMKKLSRRDQIIIKMRFGMDEYSDCNLEVCAQEIGRCRERIRQLQDKAVEKLAEAIGEI
jgi:RNA polymerase primary sigma factor